MVREIESTDRERGVKRKASVCIAEYLVKCGVRMDAERKEKP